MGTAGTFYMSAMVQLSDSDGEDYFGQHGIVLTSDNSKRTSDLFPLMGPPSTTFVDAGATVSTIDDLSTITALFS